MKPLPSQSAPCLVCTNPELGKRYLQFLDNPASVPDCKERILLIDHAGVCPACLQVVFDRLERLACEAEATGATSR